MRRAQDHGHRWRVRGRGLLSRDVDAAPLAHTRRLLFCNAARLVQPTPRPGELSSGRLQVLGVAGSLVVSLRVLFDDTLCGAPFVRLARPTPEPGEAPLEQPRVLDAVGPLEAPLGMFW